MYAIVILIIVGVVIVYGIVVGLVGILSFISSMLAEFEQATMGAIRNLIGRRKSASARLIVAPSLHKKVNLHSIDDVWVQKLKIWRPDVVQKIDLPKTPTWHSPWSTVKVTHNVIVIADVEALSKPLKDYIPPYSLLELADDFPSFPEGNVELSTPPTPELEPESIQAAQLFLPYWPRPLSFLNRFVDSAHRDLLQQFRAAEEVRRQLEDAAVRTNNARRVAFKELCERREDAARIVSDRLAEARRQYEEAKEKYYSAKNTDLDLLRKGRSGLLGGSPEGIVAHFDLVLRKAALPSFVPRSWCLRFYPEARLLLVEHQFPHLTSLEVIREHGKAARVSQKQRQETLKRIQPALLLRIAALMAHADIEDKVKTVAVNGWVNFHERSSGASAKAYCASLIADKTSLIELKIDRLDPSAAIAKMSGRIAGEVYEFTPVEPQLTLQTEDARFVKAKDTLSGMTDGQNLASMDWQDFEHLVRQMFERVWGGAGTEVKITRASRDQGVDAVIFDKDPLKGGKTVVQAKRYTNTVSVSAVRELIGTMESERAIRGILVTTSQFGPDAYAAALENGRLTLIDGQRLLGILEQVGYRFRIDIDEAQILARATRFTPLDR